MLSSDRIESAYQIALAALLKERTPDGHWVGELSTSALSTATAVMALHLIGKNLFTGIPALVVEILSPTNEGTDRIAKARETCAARRSS